MPVKENIISPNHVAARPSASATQKVEANQKGKLRNGPPRRFLVIGAVIAVLAIFFGIRYWMYASTHEDTDDAYVTGYTHQISSRITGTVEQVLVDDNWHVTAGQPLLKLDRATTKWRWKKTAPATRKPEPNSCRRAPRYPWWRLS